jgi:hypothetical protein
MPAMEFRWMGASNPAIRVWIDARIGVWWYVLLWRKGQRPYCYRSRDATPPRNQSEGRWLFGRAVGQAD